MNRSYSRGRNSNSNAKYPGRKKGGSKISVLIIMLVLLMGVGAGIIALTNGGGSTATPGASATQGGNAGVLDSGVFYEGIFIDDIAVGGLTKEQAKTKIEEKQRENAEVTGVTVTKDATNALLKLSETVYAFDTDAVLEEAWKLGREGADEERRAAVDQLKTEPRKFTTKLVSVDATALEAKVRDLTLPYFKPAKDAAFLGFFMNKPPEERLNFAPEEPGEQVNADTLWADVKKQFEEMTFGTVPMTVEPVPAAVTLAIVQADLQLLQLENIPSYENSGSAVRKSINEANKGHTFTTRIKNTTEARMTNINNAGEHVSGLLMPGDVFDFNQRTGIRDKAHGYKDAPIDIAGTEDIGIGGGVCQVSSTLFNAVIRYGGKYEADDKQATKDIPGLAVIERDNHSVPSGYVMRGMDATVDMALPSGASRKNLRFRNDFNKPVLIILYNEKIGNYWYEHCDIYGPPLLENGSPVTYDLVGKGYKELPFDPLATPGVRYSEYAKEGKPVLKPGGNGFTINMYIRKTVNGQTTEKKIYSDRCEPRPPYWYIYKGEAVPTPSPSPSPTPDVTPPPTAAPTATPAPPTPSPVTDPPADSGGGG